MKKVKKIFLYISITVFAVSFAVIAINEVSLAKRLYDKAAQENSGLFWYMAESTLFEDIVFVAVPFLLSELSLIKNGYTLLTKGQSKARKVLCVISSILALLAISAIILANNQSFNNYLSDLSLSNISIQPLKVIGSILFITWPVLIASFVLGFIRAGNAKKQS